MDGTPLRIVVTAHSSESGEETSVRTLALTAIEAATLDGRLFEIPAGYDF